jgi:glutamate 5-kinase
MTRVIVKLGSAIVADDEGALRTEVLGRICEAVAQRRKQGDEIVLVTSGAIARGCASWSCLQRPTAIGELQAASAVGQGKLYRIYDELLARARRDERAGAAHVLRHERAHALPERAPDARHAAGVAVSCR